MRNFDIIKNINGLGTVYKYCATAENFQATDPMVSAMNARLALETMVKTIYRLKGWQMGERASLLSLTTDERFEEFIDSADLMKRIHYVRKIGNNAAHASDFVGRRESFFAVLNLYYIIGSVALAWQLIESLPDFDKSLIPQSLTEGNTMAAMPQPDKADETTTKEAEAVAKGMAKASKAQPATVNAQPAVSDLTEAETRRLYIDLLLSEAGWKVTEHNGEIVPRQAGREIEVNGMPNGSGTGYADYVLFDADGTPLAVVEAKRTSVDAAQGRHQAELYADCLAAQYGCARPVIYYTNGFEMNVIDGMGYPSRKLMGFHTRDELRRMIAQRGRNDITNLQINDKITDRNYQKRAIKKVCEHFNAKHRRALLVMATGTGKTRVSISLVDVLVRNHWVSRVLFLADRIELVDQAKKNYAKLLPDMTVSSLLEKEKADKNARILFSTYKTMLNHLDKDDKTFSIGRFDLIIIDEAHRSVFGKYGAIFNYFDSLLLGLTATPRDEVDRSTYELFGMEQGEATNSYEYDEAVADGYLAPYEKPFVYNSKILTDGIDPDKLSPDEKKQFDEIKEYEKIMKGLDPDDPYNRTIKAVEIFNYVFNIDTVDHVLNSLMENGIRVEEATKIGKTIIFAYNHKHAVFIVERFAALYPELGEDFCRVIDNYEKYSSDLINRFEQADKLPQIAVSVDMLDTGIDVPEIVNLVFFKPVRSKIKFWQMIGRGTRLCKNLFGEGEDKKSFRIFDFYRNFEFFKVNAEGVQPTRQQSLVSQIFNLRTEIKYALQDSEHQGNETAKAFHDELADILLKQIKGLNRNRIDVRQQLKAVETYSNQETMKCLMIGDVVTLKNNVSQLFKDSTTDVDALKFDLMVLKSQLALVDATVSSASSEQKITNTANFLKEKKASIPQVMAKMDVLNEVTSPHFWESKSLSSLERIRKELRDLMQYAKGEQDGKTFTINIKDTFEKDESEVSVTPIRTYRRRAEDYLNEHLADDATLQKIYHLEQLTEKDIARLEQIFWKELGSKEEFDEQTKENDYQCNVAAFIRSIIGVDQGIALEKYRQMIRGAELTRMQEEYLRTLIRYVCENGDIATVVLQQSPFNKFTTTFHDSPKSLIDYIKLISKVIAA